MLIKNSFEKINRELSALTRPSWVQSDLKVLAVSKKQPDEKVAEAIHLGQKNFGENHVQNLLKRCEKFRSVNWHLIGPLQSNKVKTVIGHVHCIHSVDRIKIAREISECAEKLGIVQKILLQVNVANEDSKSGFSFEDIFVSAIEISRLKGVEINGIMSLPPYAEDPEESRIFLRKTAELFLELGRLPELSQENFCELSMGTSQDYKVAVEEGATFVRIGTALFGERDLLNE